MKVNWWKWGFDLDFSTYPTAFRIGFDQPMLCHICWEINRIKFILWITNEDCIIIFLELDCSLLSGMCAHISQIILESTDMLILWYWLRLMQCLIYPNIAGYLFFYAKKIPLHSLFYLGNSNKLPISSAVVFSFYLQHKRQSIEGSLAKSRDRLSILYRYRNCLKSQKI